jgi:2-haloacid dehalogenase/putative hydrolase of the HAD superfamily
VFRALFLDFYGTLVHEDDEVIIKISQEISSKSPFRPTKNEIARYWWDSFRSLFENSCGRSFNTQRHLEQISIEDTITHFKCDKIQENLSEMLFAYWQAPAIFDNTKIFLSRLRIPMCIVSNIDRSDIECAIRHHNLEIENIVTSEDVRSYKPISEIFIESLIKMKVIPEQVFLIGDSLTSDITGAKNMGIKTCWLNRKRRHNKSEVKPDYECTSLLEVLDLLKET